MKHSENLNLKLPEGGDPLEISDLSENFEALDGAVGEAVKNAAPYKVGDTLTTWRTDLGENWLLCNGDEFDPKEYPELASISDFTPEHVFNSSRLVNFCGAPDFRSDNKIVAANIAQAGERLAFFTITNTEGSTQRTYYGVYDFVNKKMAFWSTSPGNIVGKYASYIFSRNTIYIKDPGVFVNKTASGQFIIVPETDPENFASSIVESSDAKVEGTRNTATNSLGNLCWLSVNTSSQTVIIDKHTFDGQLVDIQTISLSTYIPEGWSASYQNVICTIPDNGKFVLFVKSATYNTSTSIVAGMEYLTYAVCLIDPENPNTRFPEKKIYIRSDYNLSISLNEGSSTNYNALYVGGGEYLVTLSISLSSPNKIVYRTLLFHSFEDFPETTVLDFTSGKQTYGLNVANTSDLNDFVIKFGNEYLFGFSSYVVGKAYITRALIGDPDNVNSARTIDLFSSYTSLINPFYVLVPSEVWPILIPRYDGKDFLCIGLFANLNTGIAGHASYFYFNVPLHGLPYFSSDLYTYIKVKGDIPNANQQTDTPAP